MKRNYIWRYKSAFFGLPFIPQALMALGKSSAIVIAPTYLMHRYLSGASNNAFYDIRDSTVRE